MVEIEGDKEPLFTETKRKVMGMVEEILAVEAVQNQSMESESSEDGAKAKPTAMELLLKKSKSCQDVEPPGEQEVQMYLATPMPLHAKAKGTEILNWWKAHSGNLPGLSKLARKYLAPPASSATSERLFSASGSTVCANRASQKLWLHWCICIKT